MPKAASYGIDVVLATKPEWSSSPIALLTNEAATTTEFIPSRQALLQAGFNLRRLFSPEHGLNATGADGHLMLDTIDTLTGLPVISLYGDKLAPSADDLQDIEIVLFDIPDIGCRYYTYLWTLTHTLQACAKHNKPIILLDRPNPLSGDLAFAEGPMLDEAACSSFIGRWTMPIRHSCTLGELALYFNSTRNIGADLKIITCPNWQRSQFPSANKSFVPTSPAIPTLESAFLYPGTCLLEATNLSLGRGTTTPFRVAGAPWLRAAETAAEFNLRASAHTSLYARPCQFTPTEAPHAHHSCKGIMLHATDYHSIPPVAIGILLIDTIARLHPDHFQWAPYPTHVNRTGAHHLDLLLGIPNSADMFDKAQPLSWQGIQHFTQIPEWTNMISPFRLYC